MTLLELLLQLADELGEELLGFPVDGKGDEEDDGVFLRLAAGALDLLGAREAELAEVRLQLIAGSGLDVDDSLVDLLLEIVGRDTLILHDFRHGV